MFLSRLSFRCCHKKIASQSHPPLLVEAVEVAKTFLRKMSNNQPIPPTPFIDGLVKANPSLKVGNKEAVETKLKAIYDGGCEKLQLIVDFDNTLTRHHKNGCLIDNSWGVMENSPLLPKGYTDKTNALRARYLPIETDPELTIEEKIPHMEAWYKQANQLLQEVGIQKDLFGQFVKTSNVEFRDHTKHMLDHLNSAKVPVLVMSAGLGDILVEVMDAFDVYHRSNTKVVSNFLSYDENGKVIGLEGGKMIHVYNKNENAFHDSEYFHMLNERGNVILLGDSIGDLQMANGVENVGSVLKIGFLNNVATAEKRLPSFLEGFDIVLVDDQSMNVPLEILRNVNGLAMPVPNAE